MDIRVSIVIPVYNVEKYLERCVESVLCQTEKKLEIILVDDGSPDRCPEICDEYAEKDDRIKVIHKKNGGLASARNAGIKLAKGEYLFFLDSDDWLEPDGIQSLYDVAVQYKVDFVRYRAFRTGWPGMAYNVPCMMEPEREIAGGYYDKARMKESIYPRLLATSSLTMGPIVGAWGSLYRLDFLKTNNLYFPEKIKYSEDIIFSVKVVLSASSFYYVDTPGVYHYFYNPASISKSFRKDRWNSCKEIIEYSDSNFAGNNNLSLQQLQYLKWFCILLSLNERKHLKRIRDRMKYCHTITRDCKKYELSFINFRKANFCVTWKQKLIMYLVILNAGWIIALF